MGNQQRPSLPEARLAILGLGLMGGSLAMALRGRCAGLLGVDPDPEARALASRLDVVEQVAAHPEALLPQADLVVLAAPVRVIVALLEQLPEWHPGEAVVMDLGSTKAQIVSAMAALPERFDPIGAHPMAGKERATLKHADPDLYQGAPFALTPLERSSARARALALELVEAVGGRPLWLDPETHDRWVGATSHLPYLVANALAAVTPAEAAPLVGPGFRSSARLAPSSLEMMLDILATNRSHLLEGVGRFRQRLEALESALVDGDSGRLTDLLTQGSEQYDLLTGYRKGA
jgi:prephenate dehydrogenase